MVYSLGMTSLSIVGKKQLNQRCLMISKKCLLLLIWQTKFRSYWECSLGSKFENKGYETVGIYICVCFVEKSDVRAVAVGSSKKSFPVQSTIHWYTISFSSSTKLMRTCTSCRMRNKSTTEKPKRPNKKLFSRCKYHSLNTIDAYF